MLALLGACLVACACGMAASTTRTWFVTFEIVAAAPWLLAVRSLARGRGRRGRHAATCALVAVALHAVLLAARPLLSDDVYRYQWDARVAAAGIDPHRYAPSAPELARLRDAAHARVNHPAVRTIYPPAAQAYFRAVDAAAHSAWAFRAAAALASLGAALALAGLLRAYGRDPRLAIVLAWSPLAAAESSVGAHVDALAVALCVAGLWAASRSAPLRAALCGALLGLSFGVKLAAAPLALLAARRAGARVGVALLGAFAIVAVALFAPHLGGPVVPGLGDYAERWRFNPSLFAAIERALAATTALRDYDLRIGARAAAAGLWTAVLLHDLAVRADPLAGGRRLVGAALLLAPAVHPWYAAWLLPFVAARPTAGWLALVALLPSSYLGEGAAVRVVEYGAPLAVAGLGWMRRARARRSRALTHMNPRL